MIDSGKQWKRHWNQPGHVGFVIPWVFHFLSRLQTLLMRSRNRQLITVNNKCKNNLVLMLKTLDKAKGGIYMNSLGFHPSDRIYYLDSCPAGLGGYSNQGFAWCFRIPDNLLFRTSNNLLEFLAAIITPWIDILSGHLNPGDCALLMTDSTTAKGWMKNWTSTRPVTTPFKHQPMSKRQGNMPKYFWTQMWRDTVSGLQGKRTMSLILSLKIGTELTMNLPQFFSPSSQIRFQTHFKILLLPSNISSWLTSPLQQFPVSK